MESFSLSNGSCSGTVRSRCIIMNMKLSSRQRGGAQLSVCAVTHVICFNVSKYKINVTNASGERGRYAPLPQENECIQCQGGSFTEIETAATTCSQCQVGRVSTNTEGENSGPEGCKACDPGKYQVRCDRSPEPSFYPSLILSISLHMQMAVGQTACIDW